MTFLGNDQLPIPGQDAQYWQRACESLLLSELECKAVYVAGLIRHLIESAGLCLEANRHLPAFLLTMGAIETLGAVVKAGANRKDDEVARNGLAYLVQEPAPTWETQVHSTRQGSYSIRDCINRRHFAAHGGRWTGRGTVLDSELTVGLLCRLVEALDRWWDELKTQAGKQQALAAAKIQALQTGGEVVFVKDLSQALSEGAKPGGRVQHDSWRASC